MGRRADRYKTGIRTHISIGSVACIMLEPGTRVSHAAVRLWHRRWERADLVWNGRAGVRGLFLRTTRRRARADKLLLSSRSWR